MLWCCIYFLTCASELISFDISLVPHAHENEYFEVYYLLSSDISIDISSSLSSYAIQMSGLAIRSSVSEKVVIIEYRPLDLSACYLPAIRRSRQTTDFKWEKKAMISLSRELNVTIWPKSVYLTRINSVVYWQFMMWVNGYVSSHPIFQPLSICLAGTDDCPYLTQNWDTFITDRWLLMLLLLLLLYIAEECIRSLYLISYMSSSFMQLSEYAVSIAPFAPLQQTQWVMSSLSPPQEVVYEVGLDKYNRNLIDCVRSECMT